MEETRAGLQQRLDYYKAELPEEQARIPALKLDLRLALESHIANCQRELGHLEAGISTACSGEADMRAVLEAEDELAECVDRIASLTRSIEEVTDELADESLWV